MLRTREELHGHPEYQVIWNGAIDRQLAAQAQRPAPDGVPVRMEGDQPSPRRRVALANPQRIAFASIRLALTDVPCVSQVVAQRLGLPRGTKIASVMANMAARGQIVATWGANPHYGGKGQKANCWLYSRKEAA